MIRNVALLMLFGLFTMAPLFAQQPSKRQLKKGEGPEECGARALYIALSSLGKGPGRYSELVRQLGQPSSEGYSVLELEHEARRWGCEVKSMQLSQDLVGSALKLPETAVIALLDSPAHFVNCGIGNAGKVDAIEFNGLRADLNSLKEVERWKGYTIVISSRPLPELRSRVSGLWYTLSGLFASATAIGLIWVLYRRARRIFRVASIVPLVFLLGCGSREHSEAITEYAFGELALEPRVEIPRVALSNEPLTVTHKLRNVGSAVLHIREIRTSCGCAAPEIDSSFIQPSGSVDLVIKLNRNKRGDQSATIQLLSDSRFASEKQIDLSWFVTSDILASPMNLSGVEVEAGDIRMFPLRIEVDTSFKSPVVSATHKSIDRPEGAEVELRGDLLSGYELLASAKQTVESGEASGSISFTLEGSTEPACVVPYVIRFCSAFEIAPSQISRSTISADRKVQFVLRSNRGVSDLTVYANDDRSLLLPTEFTIRDSKQFIAEVSIPEPILASLSRISFASSDHFGIAIVNP